MEIRKQVLGEDHADTATSLNNLAALYCSMGDYAQAEPLLHKQALQIAIGEGNIRIVDLGEAMPIDSAGRHARAKLKATADTIAQQGEPKSVQQLNLAARNPSSRRSGKSPTRRRLV